MIRKFLRKIANTFIQITQDKVVTIANISYIEASNKLKGKKVLITGGSKGIGFSIAKKFVEEGAEVVITGRNINDLNVASSQIGCKYIAVDATDFSNIDDTINKTVEMLGGLNILVNNAGISLHEGNIRNVEEKQFDQQIAVNLKASYFYSQKFIHAVENNHFEDSSILFISSERGTYVDDLPYGLTKAAINSLTQGLGKLMIKNGIRVNAVAPGITATNMTGFSKDDLTMEYASGRVYLPEEIAEVACFISSDAAKCLSGQILTCDNGNSVNSYRK